MHSSDFIASFTVLVTTNVGLAHPEEHHKVVSARELEVYSKRNLKASTDSSVTTTALIASTSASITNGVSGTTAWGGLLFLVALSLMLV